MINRFSNEAASLVEKIDLKKIAREAQVSTSLVSQVLNNRTIRVAESKRLKILEIAASHHYVPNRLASGLKLKRTNTIAILVPFTPVGFFSELIYHIEAYALARGYNTLVLNTFGDCEKEENALQFYRSQLADGFLVAAQNTENNRGVLSRMEEERVPFAFIDRYVDGIKVPTVSSDHVGTAFDLCKRLISRGKKDVLFVRRVNEPENSAIRGRLEGYAKAMRSAGLEPEVLDFTFEGDDRSDLGDQLSKRLIPQAIFLHSGFYMPHLLRTCERLGYDIGAIEFVTVDGFLIPFDFRGASKLFRHMKGNIAIAVQDTKAIASAAIDVLFDAMDGGKQERKEFFIPVELKEP